MVTLVRHDLEFILKQIKIAEAHSAGADLTDLVDSPLLPWGLRTVDGSYNNIVPGRELWGASDQPFLRLTEESWATGTGQMPPMYQAPNNYYGNGGNVTDADPRLISNLIVDQTLDNPAAIYAALIDADSVAPAGILDAIAEVQTAHQAVKDEQAILDALRAGGAPQGIIDLQESQVAERKAQLNLILEDHGIVMDGPSVLLPNRAPDEGLSASYNSFFTLFGQFFDHGLDLVKKGGNGTVYIPLSEDDPLYNPASPHTNFMVLTRASVGDAAANVTTPWVDQNQTYTSNPSHQVFLREYVMTPDGPVATGKLLEGERGLATWGDVKEQARALLGIELTDNDVGMVPMLAVDPYGEFIRGPNGLPQLVVMVPDGNGGFVASLVEGNLTTPVDPTAIGAARIPQAFLDDIAHDAATANSRGQQMFADVDTPAEIAAGLLNGTVVENPNFDPDLPLGPQNQQYLVRNPNYPDEDGSEPEFIPANRFYDNEKLDAHYITGDGRGNENIGLSAIHHLFHSEHNRVVDSIKAVILASGDDAFIAEWRDSAGNWDGERLFQAARFTTEMQYQHLVFEEFARKVQPDVDIFMVQPDVELNPAIFAEFAHVVYRFGHSMLNETVERINADGQRADMTLFEAFLNPLAFGSDTVDHHTAAGAIVRGMTGQVGQEIDEFVTNVLRNQLLGIPLDLATINIARGRDTGMPTLNEARAQFMEMAGGDTQLKPYESWSDFAVNLKNAASIVNFIAAYGTHDSITGTAEERRDAAMKLVFGGTDAPTDRVEFLNGTGDWAGLETGLNHIDLWVGGLAEKKMPFGGLLGSTFSFIFELQMENLQQADRFYYLSRVQGLNLLTELENNSLASIVMRNTDLGATGFALPGDIFSVPDHIFYVDPEKQAIFGHEDPEHDDPFLGGVSTLVERRELEGEQNGWYFRYNGADHIVIGGSERNDIIISGGGDDTIWGFGGDDYIEAGYGVDIVHGGDGDDIIVNAGTDIGEVDMLHGDAGNDVIHGGSGHALIFGGSGQDFLMTGPDGSEIRGGTGNDFILGGNGPDMLFGNEGDDWIEGGGLFDYIAGDNGELFFNSTIIGHDVINGGSGDTDYDADSGDDIMVAGEGIQKFIGMWGHDWVIHKGQMTAANADMNFPVFDSLPLEVLRDRYSQVEALSGWKFDDVLRGDDRTSDAVTAVLDPTPEGNFVHNELDEDGIARIAGLDQIIKPHMLELGEYWADGSGDEKLIFTGGNILLGGGGSDFFEGRGGDDVIDGDAWLNVRIGIRAEKDNPNSPLIAWTDGMTGKVYDISNFNEVTGQPNDPEDDLHGGKTLDLLMLSRTYNPGQLQIIREILWDNTGVDTAFYWDNYENYEITRNEDGSIRVAHITQTAGVIDPITGNNRTSDGTDTLYNIERLQFGDQTIDVALLFNSQPVGLPVISDMTPTQNQPLAVDLSAISDPDGIASELSVQWQHLVGGEWVDIGGATGTTFTPGIAHINTLLRVVVSFQDGSGNTEQVVSAVTSTVGAHIIGTNAANVLVGTAGADLIEGLAGADLIYGGAGNDTIHGGAGADEIHGDDGDDIIHGDAGADLIYGGAGNDTIYGGLGNDTIHGGAGDDTIIWNAGDGRDLVDGGSGDETVGDTFVVNGDDTSEVFRIWTRQAWIDQAPPAQRGNLDDTTEIVITRNGSNWGQVIAQLSNIEEIVLNGAPVAGETGTQGGDTFYLHGDFSGTSLNQNTITITGGSGDDTVNLSGLLSSHRVVVKASGGNDTIIGQMRPQDVIELREGLTIDDYTITTNSDGSKTASADGHSITFFGSPQLGHQGHGGGGNGGGGSGGGNGSSGGTGIYKLDSEDYRDILNMIRDGFVRDSSGYANNEGNPGWGSAGYQFIRLTEAYYTDGESGIRETQLSPREISNIVSNQDNDGDGVEESIPNTFNGSSLLTFFGQYFDHGLGFIAKGGPGNVQIGADGFPINAPRSNIVEGTGVDGIPAQYINSTSPFVDQNQAYGSHNAVTDLLRKWEVDSNGQGQQSAYLLTGDLDSGGRALLPTLSHIRENYRIMTGGDELTTADIRDYKGTGQALLLDFRPVFILLEDGSPSEQFDLDAIGHYFITGDGRTNENLMLTSIHTIWARNHNFWVDKIKAETNGLWTEEEYFQAARMMNIAEYQQVVFTEFATAMAGQLGDDDDDEIDLEHGFDGYDPMVDASISVEFAQAVYRFGHSMLNETVVYRDAEGNLQEISLVQAFLRPDQVDAIGVDALLSGAAAVSHQAIDVDVVNALRNQLVGQPIDLAALNIFRGRDMGVAPFNTVRQQLWEQTGKNSLRPYSGWEDFQARNGLSSAFIAQLMQAYPEGFETMDLWIGGLAEKPVHGQLGSTFGYIFREQMDRLQHGDRFYYLEIFDDSIFEDNPATFANIIMRNTGITDLPENVFQHAGVIDPSTLGAIEEEEEDDETPPVGNEDDDDETPPVGNEDDDDDEDDDQDGDGPCDGDEDGSSAPPPAGSGPLYQIGTAGADVLIGTSGNDTLIGLGGRDTILGGAGYDVIMGGAGNDYLFGEDGDDTIHGGAGNDEIFGGAGNDVIFGDEGNDRIYGGSGNDYINAGAGNDTVFAGAGDDIVVAEIGDGDDVYYGGDADGDSGIDTLDMSTITADIVADLGTGFMGRGSVYSVQTGNDTIWGFENIITGSGNDTITASRAVNIMDGGAGQDTFRFLSAADADGDLILGFEPGDRIDLSMADADACLAGRQSFELVTGEAFTGRGQLMVSHESRDDGDYTIVHLNTTGGAQADYKFAIKGAHNLGESDFHL